MIRSPLLARRLAAILLMAASAGLPLPALAQSAPSQAQAPKLEPVPADRIPIPAGSRRNIEPNTVMDSVSREAKNRFMQSMMAMNPMSLRDMLNLMAYKVKVKDGIKFDEVVESMRLRANKLNFKVVGHSPLYKDVVAITGKPSPRVEVFSFCDALLARELLDYSPELIVFLPCRIAVLEDAKGQLWVMMLDWDVTWIETSPNPNKMDQKLLTASAKIRDVMEQIMQAGAVGDF